MEDPASMAQVEALLQHLEGTELIDDHKHDDSAITTAVIYAIRETLKNCEAHSNQY